MDATLKMANRYPNVKFEHATGYKQAANMSSYGLRLYQARHVQGVIAGIMTQTDKICYIGAYPIPEVIREINTFFMGARSMKKETRLRKQALVTYIERKISGTDDTDELTQLLMRQNA